MLLKYPQKTVLIFVCILGFALDFVAFYPGFVAPDTLDQFNQAITGHYNDWHPPAMALFWSFLNHLHHGPQLMLVCQLLMFWCSCYLIACGVKNNLWRLIIIIIFLSPFFQNFSGYIIKDSQMALSWLLASALLFSRGIRDEKLNVPERIFVVILITYGAAVRPNALPGVIPLCVLFILQISNKLSKLKVGLFVSGILFLIIIVQAWLIPGMTKPEAYYPQDKLYLHDLTGIYVKTGKNVYPDILYTYKNFDTNNLRQKYHPATFDMLWWDNNGNENFEHKDGLVSRLLFNSWEKAISENPVVYISNRWEGFLYYLRIKNRTDYFQVVYPFIHPNNYGFALKDNRLRTFFSNAIDRQTKMMYMRPWFWCLVNIIVLIIGLCQTKSFFRSCSIALALSSLLYLLPQFFIFQTDTDFRYFYWNCIACSLAAIMLFARRLKAKKDSG